MIASSSVVLANLAYLIGAVVLAVIGGSFVWLRQRQPKSVDANVASFNRGLRALAPDSEPAPQTTEAEVAATPRIQPRPGGLRIIRTEPEAEEAEVPVHETSGQLHPGAGDDAGQRAGAESG
ncbi:MAG TPA: hypothetical protein VGI08_12490 [Diaminobutyricibacter sp.]|jgi:hypothetical protein